MSVRAIRLDPDLAQHTLYRVHLGPDLRADLVAVRSNTPRAILIVHEGDVAHYLALRDLVVHRRKRVNRPLQEACPAEKQIPLLTGEYRNAGQFLRSCRALLEHTIKSGAQNVYLITASSRIFEKHWDHALLPTSLQPEVERPRALPRPEALPTPTHTSLPIPQGAQNLMRLLPDCEIPKLVRDQYVGDSPDVHLVRLQLVSAASSDTRVLIVGATGTGKEVVALLIHMLGSTRTGMFVPVNCGAIPHDLFEGILFGCEKGVHSMAFENKKGLWRTAQGGTLFLDEVADLPPEDQVKLLRALETRQIRPLGAENDIPVNVRVIAATNRDLSAMVAEGRFREDLYYRLRATTIRTPSLSEHPADIPAIATSLWRGVTHDPASALADEVLLLLQGLEWPGNVRELLICLTRVHDLFGKEDIRGEHILAALELDRSNANGKGNHNGNRNGNARAGDLPDISVFRLECLRHVLRAADTLRAAQVPLRDVMKGRSRVPETYQAIASTTEACVTELEQLCMHPLQFGSTRPFGVVRRVKERLRDFGERLAADPDDALQFWKSDVEPHLDDAITVLFDEAEKLTR